MYERSAIVLERYFEQIFGFNKASSLRTNYQNYKRIIEEIKEYQKMIEEEDKVMEKFDIVAVEIEELQKKQSKIHEENVVAENERDVLFNDLGENPNVIDKKIQKIEKTLIKNNEELIEIREKYVKALVIFIQRQKERNQFARMRRAAEEKHVKMIENANKFFSTIDIEDIKKMKMFVQEDKKQKEQEIIDIMLKNGENEKIPFNQYVIEDAVKTRIDIAKREAEIYIGIYERTKKLLAELNNENVKLAKSEKVARDSTVKLTFLNAEKEYIASFLDNERMAVMNGRRNHERLMEEACKNFELDIIQIDNLYELILKETMGRATKKAYKELYNSNYLNEIEEKERDFEEEITSLRLNMGAFINSNYWRVEGIRNLYKVFQDVVSEEFGKDLSEYNIEPKKEEKPIVNNYVEEETTDDYEENYYDNTDNIEEYNDSEEEYDDSEDYAEEEYYEADEEYYEDDEEYEEEYDDEYDEEEEYYDDDEEYEEDDDINEDDNNDDIEILLQGLSDKEDEEENLDEIIQKSRKRGTKKKTNNQDNKGLFNKFFKNKNTLKQEK